MRKKPYLQKNTVPSMKRVIEKLEQAQIANGGRNWKEDWCQCAPDEGAAPCEYCTMWDALNHALIYMRSRTKLLRRRAKE